MGCSGGDVGFGRAVLRHGAGATRAASKTEYVSVYINGEKSDLQGMMVNNYIYLPLRDMAGVLAVDIDWDNVEKRVELHFLDDYERIWPERKTRAAGYLQEDGNMHWDERALSFDVRVEDEHLWLPISFFETMTEANMGWDGAKNGVCIDHIPMWQGGRWTLEGWLGYDKPEIAFDEMGNGWVALRLGEGTLGCDYLWRLGADGSRSRVDSFWSIDGITTYGDRCYYLANYLTFISEVRAIDISSSEITRLGLEDMQYCLGLRPCEDMWQFIFNEQALQVNEDGVYASGIAASAVVDGFVRDTKQARESYGLYRVWPGGQELVERYDLPE